LIFYFQSKIFEIWEREKFQLEKGRCMFEQKETTKTKRRQNKDAKSGTKQRSEKRRRGATKRCENFANLSQSGL